MRISKLPIISAVLTALLSTLCCLPALLFIFFGISGGILTFFTQLEFLRIPLGVITLILLAYGVKLAKSTNSCSYKKSEIYSNSIILFLLITLIAFLLFYPEIIPLFLD